jgi:hypothetical protein
MPSDPFAGFTDEGPQRVAPPQPAGDPFAGFTDKGPSSEGGEGRPSSPEPKDFLGKLRYRFEHPPSELSLIGMAGRAWKGLTLPGDVWAGRVDPLSPEAIERARELAQVTSPINPAVRAGDLLVPGLARRAIETEAPAAATAAQTAAELGTPLPRGLASPSPAMQAVTQAARQFPGVGEKISEPIAQAIEASGGRVGEIASELSGGVTGRGAAGAVVRPALNEMIEDNKGVISEGYNTLRGMIDPNKEFPLTRTKAVLDKIVAARAAAKKLDPAAGLEDVSNLADQGAGFEGLQRARSDYGSKLKFGEPHPGYTEGERKQIYGAMTSDMENIVRQAANNPAKAEEAVGALRSANANAQKIIERNGTLQRLSNIQSEEGLIGTLVKAAGDKTGNIKMLAELRAGMPKEDFEQISGVALNELGHNPTTGKFSLNQFVTGWNKMSNQAKAVLIADKNHRKALDDIAHLGTYLKDADKYANVSSTGRAVLLGGAASAVGGSIAHLLATGDPVPLLTTLGGLGAGFTFGHFLSRPASASAIARWSRAVQTYNRSPSFATKATLRLTTGDMLKTLGGTVGQAVQLASPKASGTDRNQPPAQRGIPVIDINVPK